MCTCDTPSWFSALCFPRYVAQLLHSRACVALKGVRILDRLSLPSQWVAVCDAARRTVFENNALG